MKLTTKEMYDLNNMNVAAQNVNLGGLIDSPFYEVTITAGSPASNVYADVLNAMHIASVPADITLIVYLLGDDDKFAKIIASGSVANYDADMIFATAPEKVYVISVNPEFSGIA